MKTNRMLVGMLLLGLLLGLAIPWMQGLRGPGLAQGPGQTDASPHANMGTAFTYQGQLKNASGPVDDDCDFEFSLWDAVGSGEPPTGGTQIDTTQAKTNVTVNGGLFTIPDLDFGGTAFNGEARWLQIAVRCPTGSGDYTTLAPRQALTPTPYALYAPTAPWSGLSGVPAGFVDGVDDDTTSFWSLTGNSSTTAGTNVLGTTDNQALELHVNNTRALRLEPHATSPNVIGGYSSNSVTDGVYATTISGGGSSSFPNRVTDRYGTVGGGYGNRAGNGTGTTYDADSATVSGGASNEASASYTTIGGGFDNQASARHATIPGGFRAQASHYGEMAYASGSFVGLGMAQTSVYVLRETTSDETETELFLNGEEVPSERLTIADGHTVTFDILLVARSSTGESMGCTFQGVIENTGGATTFFVAPGKLCQRDGVSWDADVVADNDNDALQIEVTGEASTNIRWVARVQTAEVSY